MLTFYEVVNIYGVFYASVNPNDKRLYSKSELPDNCIILDK